MEILHKAFGANVKATNLDKGELEAIVAVFNNVDDGKERILQGYFLESLQRKLPKGVWMHDWKIPVAKTLEARELAPGDKLLPEDIKDLGGLFIKGAFNLETQRGREAYSDVKFGLVDEFSIGYRNTITQYNEDDDVLELVKGELFEWSPVLVGMNRDTVLLGVKGGATFDDQFSACLDTLDSLLGRWDEIAAKRLEDKPALSEAHAKRVAEAMGRLKALEKMTIKPDPDAGALVEKARSAYAQIMARRTLSKVNQ